MREINWITENTCSVCGKDLGVAPDSSGICYECTDIDHSFTKGFSCTTYEGPVKEILSGLKYKGRAYYAKKIADIMTDRAFGFIDDYDLDMIIPVPMYRKKERTRGYNQSELLATMLSKKLGLLLCDDILVKKRSTSSMSSLNSSERRINLHNAFGIGYNDGKALTGKTVLLVDDVYTTGSTVDACAEVLNHNGASGVYVFTFTSGVNMRKRIN